MSFEIPEPYVWDDSFCVFYALLDDEHKGLFKGIFDLAAKPTDAAVLGSLISLVEKHFADEEEMMIAKKYDEKLLTPHQKAHRDFVSDLKGLAAPVNKDSIDFAKKWLVNHIKGTDFKYKGRLG
ncbi:unnamed protein product [Owenia fusiformis]|uniref:Hemerythrin-like domain-containing protein n=1 Tax=Owenia fusiformis TaxID=6347 RepID=A0A8S4PRB5_OWEFU|nr:unnamed protein product [Owenia fusiformis]